LDARVRQLLKEIAARQGIAAQAEYHYLSKELGPTQQAFIEAKGRNISACCPRRAGKSIGIIERLVKAARSKPHAPTLYLGLTRDSAKEAIWDDMLRLLDEAKVKHKPNLHDLIIRFPNGSKVSLWGAEKSNMKDRLRGRKFLEAVVDEAPFFPDLQQIVDALAPTLADFQGSLVLAGSPGLAQRGYFWKCWGGELKKAWDAYTWTAAENPALKDHWADELAHILKTQFGGNEENPVFRREWLGEWVKDDIKYVYRFNREVNLVRDLPDSLELLVTEGKKPKDYETVLGLDIGNDDSNAITIGAFSRFSPDYYVIDCWKSPGEDIGIDGLADKVHEYIRKYKPKLCVADTGGGGKFVVTSLRQEFGLPLIAANKGKEKAFRIRKINTDFMSGRIKVLMPQCKELINEMEGLLREDDGSEDESCPNDLCDSFNYGYTNSRAYAYDPKNEILEEEFIEAWMEKETQDQMRFRDDDV
jgi:predicted phage terminase large subunit-like protein